MRKKILLIEDNKEMRENTVEILELAQYTVTAAQNGKLGLELAAKELPDLIICDIMMPFIDGYGVLHLLSKSDKTSGIPFIFLTAKAERSDFRKGMEMGADDYLTKPFDDIELLKAVESRLQKNELLKKEFKRTVEGLDNFMEEANEINSLEKLSEKRETRNYKKKEVIYSEDHNPKGLYFISKGKVKTSRSNEFGKEFITGLYKQGDFFGYLPLLEESKYSDSAAALEYSEICMIPKEDFNKLIFRSHDLSKKFIKMLAGDLLDKEKQLVRLAYSSVRKRIAEALITLCSQYKNDESTNFQMNISREDLASIAGTATETAIRTLSDLKDEKLIEINAGNITILQLEKLVKMKN